MVPLWTTATAPAQSSWGWALASVGGPWVAQRVWPMPSVPGSCRSPSCFSRLASLPALRSTWSPSAPRIATPALS